MEKRVCKSCCATKDIEEFDGYKTCNRCREAKRKCYKKNQKEYNQARREERAKGSQLCEECRHKIKHENWDAHFHYALHPNSKLNVLMKGYLRKLGNLRKEGKLNDKLQADIKAEYEKQKRETRKRLNKQFPNRFADEEETPEHEGSRITQASGKASCSIREPQPEPEKPKPDIDKVLNHVHQLLMNDEFLENYFMLFGRHKDRILIEIPVDKS